MNTELVTPGPFLEPVAVVADPVGISVHLSGNTGERLTVRLADEAAVLLAALLVGPRRLAIPSGQVPV